VTHGELPHHSQPVPSAACHAAPTIAALRAYATEIRDAEVARALARLGGLAARDKLLVQALAERIVSKLLHRPLTALAADGAGADTALVLRQLFQLEPEPGPSGCARSAPPAHNRSACAARALLPSGRSLEEASDERVQAPAHR